MIIMNINICFSNCFYHFLIKKGSQIIGARLDSCRLYLRRLYISTKTLILLLKNNIFNKKGY